MRNKILLVLEDYSELVYWETFLKKVGWDVIGSQNEFSISQQLLSFNPDFLICSTNGSKVSGVRIAQKVKRRDGWPKILFFTQRGSQLPLEQVVDLDIKAVLESPVKPRELLQLLSDQGGVDIKVALKKVGTLQKARDSKTADEEESGSNTFVKGAKKDNQAIHVKSGKNQSNLNVEVVKSKVKNSNPTKASKKYEKYTKELDKKHSQNGLNKSLVASQKKDFRAEENTPEVKQIDEQRKNFVKALYKKEDEE